MCGTSSIDSSDSCGALIEDVLPYLSIRAASDSMYLIAHRNATLSAAVCLSQTHEGIGTGMLSIVEGSKDPRCVKILALPTTAWPISHKVRALRHGITQIDAYNTVYRPRATPSTSKSCRNIAASGLSASACLFGRYICERSRRCTPNRRSDGEASPRFTM